MSSILEKSLMIGLGALMISSFFLVVGPILHSMKNTAITDSTTPGDPPWLFFEIIRGTQYVQTFPDKLYSNNVTVPKDWGFSIENNTVLQCQNLQNNSTTIFTHDLVDPAQLIQNRTAAACLLFIFVENDSIIIYLG